MRSAGASLISALLSKVPLFTADCFTFSLLNGTTLYYTSFDQTIEYGGTYWQAVGPVLSRSTWNVKNTLEVPTLDIYIYSNGSDYSGGNLKELAHNGVFDGCHIQLDRAFMPTAGNTTYGLVTLFGGRCGPLEITDLGIKMTAKGYNVLMQQYMPKNRYKLSCIHTLYDAGCGVSRAANTLTETVSSANAIAVNWSAGPADYQNFALGTLTFTSGVANGTSRQIEATSSTGVVLQYPLYEIPSAGDTFTITRGCQKTRAYCTSVFNNLQNRRGFDFIPPAEMAM